MAVKTKAILLCEGCEKPILNKEDGFLIYGAVCPADTTAAPLLGEAFPSKVTVAVKDLGTTALCRPCFVTKLGLRTTRVAVSAYSPSAHEESNTHEAPMAESTEVEELGFDVVDPLGSVKPKAASTNGRSINVGALQEVAPGAHVNAGMGVLPKSAAQLPVLPGPIREGDTIRVNQNHPNFQALRGRAARVERFRELEKDFVFRFAGGQPMLGRMGQLDKIG